MPAALYAISFKSTLSVLAVCSLEQQKLADAGAWQSFRKRLVGDQLRISMTQVQLVIDGSDLAVDEIDASDPAPLIADPYAFQLTGPAAGTLVTPGDGTPKRVGKPGNAASVALTDDGTLTVTLSNAPSQRITVGLLFEGQALVTNTLAPPATIVKFSVGPLLVGARYVVLIIAQDVPTAARVVEAVKAEAP